jgi:hypothetical protein
MPCADRTCASLDHLPSPTGWKDRSRFLNVIVAVIDVLQEALEMRHPVSNQ